MGALSYSSNIDVNNDASGTSLAYAAFNLVSGRHVFVYVRWEGGDTTISLSDTAGNTYTSGTKLYAGGSGCGGVWFYCLNATGNASNVITVTFGAARTFRRSQCVVLSGDTPSAVTEASNTVSATTTTISTSGTLNIGSGGFLIAGLSTRSNALTATFSNTASDTWTNIVGSNTYKFGAHAAIATSRTSQTITVNTGAGVGSGAVLIAIAIEPGASAFQGDKFFSVF